MEIRKYIAIALSLFVLVLIGCHKQSQYEKTVEKELKKDIRNDSLFLGYSLGMGRDQFYDYSWDLNRKRIVKEGGANSSVEYKITDELPHKATMNFYPEFNDKKVSKMLVKFSYDGWAPWNKNLSADSLIFDVEELMREWYGNGFFKAKSGVHGPTLVKIDGNREILIFKDDNDRTVNVVFSDLAITGKTSHLITD